MGVARRLSETARKPVDFLAVSPLSALLLVAFRPGEVYRLKVFEF